MRQRQSVGVARPTPSTACGARSVVTDRVPVAGVLLGMVYLALSGTRLPARAESSHHPPGHPVRLLLVPVTRRRRSGHPLLEERRRHHIPWAGGCRPIAVDPCRHLAAARRPEP